MSVYGDVRAFQTALDVSSMTSRFDFLYMVKWAKVEDTQPYPNTDSLKAMVFAMHIGLLPESINARPAGEHSLCHTGKILACGNGLSKAGNVPPVGAPGGH